MNKEWDSNDDLVNGTSCLVPLLPGQSSSRAVWLVWNTRESRDGEDHWSLILISKIFANDLDLLCDLDSWQWSLIFDLDLAWFDLDNKITNLPNLNVGIFQYINHNHTPDHTPDTFKRNYPNPNYSSILSLQQGCWNVQDGSNWHFG